MKDKKDFLHYLGKIEGRGEGEYALYKQDIEIECLPLAIVEDELTQPSKAAVHNSSRQ